MVRIGPTPVPQLPHVIAIDEWAWRRGRRYGTIIVDLERNAIAELLPDRDADTVAEHLRRWLLAPEERARQMLRFLTSPLWRAYISTYVEGYRLLGEWLEQVPQDARLARFGRLLDEPLTPALLRAELGQ